MTNSKRKVHTFNLQDFADQFGKIDEHEAWIFDMSVVLQKLVIDLPIQINLRISTRSPLSRVEFTALPEDAPKEWLETKIFFTFIDIPMGPSCELCLMTIAREQQQYVSQLIRHTHNLIEYNIRTKTWDVTACWNMSETRDDMYRAKSAPFPTSTFGAPTSMSKHIFFFTFNELVEKFGKKSENGRVNFSIDMFHQIVRHDAACRFVVLMESVGEYTHFSLPTLPKNPPSGWMETEFVFTYPPVAIQEKFLTIADVIDYPKPTPIEYVLDRPNNRFIYSRELKMWSPDMSVQPVGHMPQGMVGFQQTPFGRHNGFTPNGAFQHTPPPPHAFVPTSQMYQDGFHMANRPYEYGPVPSVRSAPHNTAGFPFQRETPPTAESPQSQGSRSAKNSEKKIDVGPYQIRKASASHIEVLDAEKKFLISFPIVWAQSQLWEVRTLEDSTLHLFSSDANSLARVDIPIDNIGVGMEILQALYSLCN